MEQLKILYIDDKPDPDLDIFFSKCYKNEEYKVIYNLIYFNPDEGYESLLKNNKVKESNIIFIDSKLFENRTVSSKFTGEEFKLVLQKFYPYIEVIVITQNDKDPEIDMIEKYKGRSSSPSAAIDFYKSTIPLSINNAIKRIKQYRILASRINYNDSWENVLREKVIATLDGCNTYDSLSKSDIDELICTFKLIQEKFDD